MMAKATRAVALRFDVSESWVSRIKQRRRESGQVAPRRLSLGRQSGELGLTG